MRTSSTSEAVFGAADGMVSLLGLLAGAMVARAAPSALLTMAGGAAIAAAVSMAGGDWLSGKSVRQAIAMGLATLLGSLVPVLPVVLVPGLLGVLLAVLLVVLLGVGISEVRSRTGKGRLSGYVSTFTVLIAASGLAVAVSLLLGVTG